MRNILGVLMALAFVLTATAAWAGDEYNPVLMTQYAPMNRAVVSPAAAISDRFIFIRHSHDLF